MRVHVITLQSGQLWHAEPLTMSSCFLIYLLCGSKWEYLFQTCRGLKHERVFIECIESCSFCEKTVISSAQQLKAYTE